MEKLLEVIESELHHIATIIQLSVEGMAILIIAFSILKTVAKFFRSYRRQNSEYFYHQIRLDLGLSLALSLELLLAADIIATAVSPTWEAVGLLASIASIRTFLNYFLQKEVTELEEEGYQKRQNKSPF